MASRSCEKGIGFFFGGNPHRHDLVQSLREGGHHLHTRLSSGPFISGSDKEHGTVWETVGCPPTLGLTSSVSARLELAAASSMQYQDSSARLCLPEAWHRRTTLSTLQPEPGNLLALWLSLLPARGQHTSLPAAQLRGTDADDFRGKDDIMMMKALYKAAVLFHLTLIVSSAGWPSDLGRVSGHCALFPYLPVCKVWLPRGGAHGGARGLVGQRKAGQEPLLPSPRQGAGDAGRAALGSASLEDSSRLWGRRMCWVSGSWPWVTRESGTGPERERRGGGGGVGSGRVGLPLSGVSTHKSSLLSLELLGCGRGRASRVSRAPDVRDTAGAQWPVLAF